MPKKIDLSTVDPKHAKRLIQQREAKAREYALNKEKLLSRNEKWKLENPEKVKATSKSWALENKDVKAANTAASKKRCAENLSDGYVRHLTASVQRRRAAKSGGNELYSSDIPDGLLPALRESIAIRRGKLAAVAKVMDKLSSGEKTSVQALAKTIRSAGKVRHA